MHEARILVHQGLLLFGRRPDFEKSDERASTVQGQLSETAPSFPAQTAEAANEPVSRVTMKLTGLRRSR